MKPSDSIVVDEGTALLLDRIAQSVKIDVPEIVKQAGGDAQSFRAFITEMQCSDHADAAKILALLEKDTSTYGLFIGIDAYPEDSGFHILKYASSDASNIRSALIRAPTAMQSRNTSLHTDVTAGRPVIRNAIIAQVNALSTSATSGDTLIFYFAGHGFVTEFPGGSASYLAPADVARDGRNRPIPETAIAVEYVRDVLTESKAANVLMILDACRSSTARLARGATDAIASRFGSELQTRRPSDERLARARWEIMSACSPTSTAFEDDALQSGLWTHALCAALDRHALHLRSTATEEDVPSTTVFETAKDILAGFERDIVQEPMLYSSSDEISIRLLYTAPAVHRQTLSSPWRNLRSEIDAAGDRIGRRIGNWQPPVRTPLMRSRRLEVRFGCKRLYFKLETMQGTGSCKYRGATNAVERVQAEGKHPIIVAASAGNHGVGVAAASLHRECECHIFMPENTPLTKTAAVRRYTSHVILTGVDYDDCERQARHYAEKNSAVFVHRFDDPYVVAGQGTVGVELIRDWDEIASDSDNLGEPDYVIIPCGGGGLLAGAGTVVAEEWSKTRIIAVEPENVPSLYSAMDQGAPVRVPGQATLADGIAVRSVGRNTLECIRRFLSLDDVWKASEDSIALAMLSLLEDARVLPEGAGAAPLAGMFGREVVEKGFFRDKIVICLIGGGNADISSVSTVISRGLILQRRRARFRFTVPDRPGALADLTKALADTNVQIVDLSHTRYSDRVGRIHAQVDVIVETEDAEHAESVFQQLQADRRFGVSLSSM